MNKRKIFIIALLCVAATSVWAQSVEDGLKELYYGRYETARQAFEKAAAAKPDDRAYYYQGIAVLGLENKDAAAAVFQKGLQAVPNSPLLQVGMGRIDLINGNAAAAKQKFDAASTATNGANGDVARAIADANTVVKGGDRGYALSVMEKLLNNEGRKKKEQYTPTAADYIELGDAYRSLGGENGGKAISTYEKALEVDPKNAEAVMKQGLVNYNAKLLQEAVNDFNKATQVDPAYAPAYYELYEFYITPTKNQLSLENASKYLQKYMEVVGPGTGKLENEYNLAAIAFYNKNYDEAINKAKSVLPQAKDAYKGKLTRLLADAYLQKGDSVNAKATMDAYAQEVGPDKLEVLDYKELSAIYSRFKAPDSTQQDTIDKQALEYLEKYATEDTTKDVARFEEVAQAYADAHAFDKAGDWYKKVLALKQELKDSVVAIDYYHVGQNYYLGAGATTPPDSAALNKADSAFATLAEKFPDITTGHYWRGTVNMAKDEKAEKGIALPYFQKYLSMAEGDPAKNKVGLTRAYTYILIYYYNKEDKANIQTYMDKLSALDPNNETVKQIKENLASQEKAPQKSNGPKQGGSTKPGGSSKSN